MNLITSIIVMLRDALVLFVIVSVILSYVLDRYHPLRRWVDALVDPLLTPIRRVVPLVGMLDFSPVVLIILIQVVARLLINLLR
jgi:YggT family protein